MRNNAEPSLRSSGETKRCPGGYLIRGNRLCGPSGNRCVDRCAFEYLAAPEPEPDPFYRPDLQGIFRDHRCWKCNDGEKPCAMGGTHRCDYPRARND